MLHLEFVRLGKERHKITYKLLALLPKIYQGDIYREKGFSSIFEYSFKLAGLSEALVKKALNLDKDLQNKPYLQKAIETQGIHKVALVAKIATPETDLFFADKVENMSKSALNELSKEMRGKVNDQSEHIGGAVMKIEFDEEMQFLFLKLKKEIGKELSNKEALRRILKKMTEASQMMAKRTKPQREAKKQEDFPGKISKTVSRYIPVGTKRAAIERTAGRCAHEYCNKPFDVFHHIKRWAISKNHESIIPLCKEHHEFAHNGLLRGKNEDFEGRATVRVDMKYKDHRRLALARGS